VTTFISTVNNLTVLVDRNENLLRGVGSDSDLIRTIAARGDPLERAGSLQMQALNICWVYIDIAHGTLVLKSDNVGGKNAA